MYIKNIRGVYVKCRLCIKNLEHKNINIKKVPSVSKKS